MAEEGGLFGHDRRVTMRWAIRRRSRRRWGDANGNRISQTDANNNTTSYQYDALNRLMQVTYPTNPATTTSYTYDFRGNVVNTVDQLGRTTHNVYDLAGRLLSTTSAYGADSPEIDHRSLLIPITILLMTDQRGRSEATLAF